MERRLEYLSTRLQADIEQETGKVLGSGCVDIEDAPNDFTLPTEVFCAILKRELDSFMPISMDGKKNVDNIYLFT